MSSTRLTHPTKTPLKSFFTMMELIAVISITAILLTITMRIMKTDSTKANAQIIGSALNFAQAYALSNLTVGDTSPADGFNDEYVMVIIDNTENKVYVKKFKTGTTNEEILRTDKLAGGSAVTDTAGTTPSNFLIGFRSKGDPIKVSTIDHPSPLTDPPTDASLKTLATQETITVTDSKNTATKQTIRVKPFTGKVTYY